MALPGETEQLKVRARARVVDTPMTRLLHTDWFREEYAKAIPMNRYGTTVEIAAAVMYLVSDAASYTSGVLLPVDGGFVASGARGR